MSVPVKTMTKIDFLFSVAPLFVCYLLLIVFYSILQSVLFDHILFHFIFICFTLCYLVLDAFTCKQTYTRTCNKAANILQYYIQPMLLKVCVRGRTVELVLYSVFNLHTQSHSFNMRFTI